METKGYEGWAIVELMGHRKLGGRVSEAVIAGAALLRIDVPKPKPEEGFTTQFYGGSALYAITPATEDLVRAFAQGSQPMPVSRYELPRPERQLPPGMQTVSEQMDEEDEGVSEEDGSNSF